MSRYGFELFVAWRYLRERGHRSGWITIGVGLGLIAGAAVCYLLANHITVSLADLAEGKRNWKQTFRMGSLVFGVLGNLVLVFGVYQRIQSIFTTISTFGIYLGTAALVIVLSVMNGFEVDLRQKILGSNAHVLVSREEGAFTDYREVFARLEKMCAPGGACVVAQTPYITSEVVVTANSNYNSVIIKGIDPASVGRVTDLERNLSVGSALDRLWPIGPDGKAVPYTNRTDSGAPPPPDDDREPADFSGGEESAPGTEGDSEPADFSQGSPDGGAVHIPVRSLTFPDGHTSGPHIDPQLGPLDGILVGKELAKNLHLYLGQEVEVVSPIGKDSPTGQVLPRVRSFRVAGTFFSGMYEYDVKSVYVSMPALQRFLSLGDEVTGIEIKASDMDATGPLVETIRQALGPTYRVQDWKELNRSLFSALKLEKFMMFSILAIIILVASFSIISNLIMVVVEKAREIAILKSMGSSSWAVMRVFVLEGLYMGLLGTGMGILNGIGYCWAIKNFGLPLDPDVYYIDKLPVAMEAAAIVAVTLAGLGISAAATIYPAYIGAQLRPVDGLRNE